MYSCLTLEFVRRSPRRRPDRSEEAPPRARNAHVCIAARPSDRKQNLIWLKCWRLLSQNTVNQHILKGRVNVGSVGVVTRCLWEELAGKGWANVSINPATSTTQENERCDARQRSPNTAGTCVRAWIKEETEMYSSSTALCSAAGCKDQMSRSWHLQFAADTRRRLVRRPLNEELGCRFQCCPSSVGLLAAALERREREEFSKTFVFYMKSAAEQEIHRTQKYV